MFHVVIFCELAYTVVPLARLQKSKSMAWSQEAISFQTANGVTDMDTISNFQTESFKEPIKACVLEDTPPVLSVGKNP